MHNACIFPNAGIVEKWGDKAETHSKIPTSPEFINLCEPSGSVSITSAKARPNFLATSASFGLMQGIPGKKNIS